MTATSRDTAKATMKEKKKTTKKTRITTAMVVEVTHILSRRKSTRSKTPRSGNKTGPTTTNCKTWSTTSTNSPSARSCPSTSFVTRSATRSVY